jgi:hypothetical protein
MIRTPSLERLGYSLPSLPGLRAASRLATFEGTYHTRSIDPIQGSFREPCTEARVACQLEVGTSRSDRHPNPWRERGTDRFKPKRQRRGDLSL